MCMYFTVKNNQEVHKICREQWFLIFVSKRNVFRMDFIIACTLFKNLNSVQKPILNQIVPRFPIDPKLISLLSEFWFL